MSRLDHDKASRRLAGEKEARFKERGEKQAFTEIFAPKKDPDSVPQASGWLGVDKSIYPDITPPELFFLNLAEFYRLMLDYYAVGEAYARTPAGKQMRTVAKRGCNIRPIGPMRDEKEFVIVLDGEGVFSEFRVVWKDQPLRLSNRKLSIVDRCPFLNATIPYKYAQPEVGLRNMQHCLQAMVIPPETDLCRKAPVYFRHLCNFSVVSGSTNCRLPLLGHK